MKNIFGKMKNSLTNSKKEKEVITQIEERTDCQSRWGYHPCNYKTYLKLKKLRKHYFEAQVKAANWYRWARKIENNREGKMPSISPVFCEIINSEHNLNNCARPNPLMSSYAIREDACYNYERSMSRNWISDGENISYIYNMVWTYKPSGSYYYERDCPNHKNTILVRDHQILMNFELARMPRKTKAEVLSLTLSENQIDTLLSEFE